MIYWDSAGFLNRLTLIIIPGVCVSNTFLTLGEPVGNLMTKAKGWLWAYVPTLMAEAVKSFLTEEPLNSDSNQMCKERTKRCSWRCFHSDRVWDSHHWSWKTEGTLHELSDSHQTQRCLGWLLPGWLHSRICVAEGVPSGHQLPIFLTKGSKTPTKATA